MDEKLTAVHALEDGHTSPGWLDRLGAGARNVLRRENVARHAETSVEVSSIPVFYINLDHREDRRRLSEHLWHEQLRMRSVTRVPGVLDAVAYRGCAKAHIRAVDRILESNAAEPFVLLAEDDVVLLPDKSAESLLETVTDALTRLDDLNVLFLTASLHRFRKSKVDGVVRLLRKGALAMPALVIRRDYLPKLRSVYARALTEDRPIDKLTRKVQGRDRWYALDPPYMRQAAGYSDIEEKFVDYGYENR
jgi:hypothetical protein